MVASLQDGGKIFIASADRQARVWDLTSNQVATVGSHDQPIKTCHWIKGATYSCLMTGSWDKTLRVCNIVSSFVLNLYIMFYFLLYFVKCLCRFSVHQ